MNFYVDAQKHIISNMQDFKYVKIGNKYIYVSMHTCFVIPSQYLYLNPKILKVENSVTLVNTIKSLYEKQTDRVVDTGLSSKDRYHTVRFFNNGSEVITVNHKLLLPFNKYVTEFRGKTAKDPLYLYESDILLGFVMPINYSFNTLVEDFATNIVEKRKSKVKN